MIGASAGCFQHYFFNFFQHLAVCWKEVVLFLNPTEGSWFGLGLEHEIRDCETTFIQSIYIYILTLFMYMLYIIYIYICMYTYLHTNTLYVYIYMIHIHIHITHTYIYIHTQENEAYEQHSIACEQLQFGIRWKRLPQEKTFWRCPQHRYDTHLNKKRCMFLKFRSVGTICAFPQDWI